MTDNDLQAAWDAVHDALPAGWTVARPSHHIEAQERPWHVYAADLLARAKRRETMEDVHEATPYAILPPVTLTIRAVRPSEHDALVAIALRAWEPVFASVNAVLGADLAPLLHGEDWRVHQAAEVRGILASEAMTTWVADVDGAAVGFAAALVADPVRSIGEVRIIGVDPAAQHRGVGTALTRHAERWLSEQGMVVAFIGTGGDAGHAPARQLYEALGYRLFPSAQYYRVLRDRNADPSGPDHPQ